MLRKLKTHTLIDVWRYWHHEKYHSPLTGSFTLGNLLVTIHSSPCHGKISSTWTATKEDISKRNRSAAVRGFINNVRLRERELRRQTHRENSSANFPPKAAKRERRKKKTKERSSSSPLSIGFLEITIAAIFVASLPLHRNPTIRSVRSRRGRFLVGSTQELFSGSEGSQPLAAGCCRLLHRVFLRSHVSPKSDQPNNSCIIYSIASDVSLGLRTLQMGHADPAQSKGSTYHPVNWAEMAKHLAIPSTLAESANRWLFS